MLGRNAMGKVEVQYESLSRFFSLAEIQSATNNFDDQMVIGIGGFGKVYKGFIDNGSTTVAINRLNPESNQAHGTLADHPYKINTRGDGSGLIWDQRLNICIGAARGLDYLHTGTQQSFIHRDVKTTNIRLDEKWVSKISDFGLSKGTASFSKTHIITTAVKGTFGYLDPDYFRTQRLTMKSVVYAFGVVMLGVLCGRPSVDTRLEEDQISLIFWARHCIETGRLSQIIDTSLRGQISPNALKCFVKVAYKCLHDRPQERPTMAEVVAGLKFALASQHGAIIDDDRGPHPRTKKKSLSLMKRFVTSITSALDLFLASLHCFEMSITSAADRFLAYSHWFGMCITSAADSNPPYNNFMSNDCSWLLCIGLRRPLLLQWISSWLLCIPMSNDGMLTTRVSPNRAQHHTSTSTNGNNNGNQSYTSN